MRASIKGESCSGKGSAQHAPRINDDLVFDGIEVDGDKLCVVHQQQQDVGFFHDLFQVHQRKTHLAGLHVGVADQNLADVLTHEVFDDVQRG